MARREDIDGVSVGEPTVELEERDATCDRVSGALAARIDKDRLFPTWLNDDLDLPLPLRNRAFSHEPESIPPLAAPVRKG